MLIRKFRAGFAVACLATSLTAVGCGGGPASTSSVPQSGPVPAAAHYPGDPASKGVENTPPPKPK